MRATTITKQHRFGPNHLGLLRLVIAMFLTAFTAATDSFAQDTLTMPEVVGQVVSANNRVAAARFMEESARQNIGATSAWPDPMLMFGAKNVPTDFDFDSDPMTMRMIGLAQEIPYAGYVGLQQEAARAQADATSAQRVAVELDLSTVARLAYIDLYYKTQTRNDLVRQQDLIEQIIESATAKLRSNQAAQDEVLAAQADLWRLQSMILSTEQEIDAARLTMNSLRNVDPNTELPALAEPYLGGVPDNADPWLSEAQNNYPQLRQLASQAESYRLSASAARRMTWPMLTLQAEYGFRSGYETGLHGEIGEERGDMLSFQANISIPIFSLGKQRSMARSMEAMSRSSVSEAEQVAQDVRAAILSLHQRAQRLEQSLDLYHNRIIPAAEDAYRSALSGYSANRTPLSTVLNYEVNIYRDRITAIQLAQDLARTLSEVRQYTATPLQREQSRETNN